MRNDAFDLNFLGYYPFDLNFLGYYPFNGHISDDLPGDDPVDRSFHFHGLNLRFRDDLGFHAADQGGGPKSGRARGRG